MSSIDIDALYRSFCSRLPAEIRSAGMALARDVGLAPTLEIPWSAVFKHEVTLRAPSLFAEGMPELSSASIENAVLAHMLSVIEAFGSDRVADRQAMDTPELRRVLSQMRAARDEALEIVGGPAFREVARQADRRTHQAIDEERVVLVRGEPVDMARYTEISAGKQAVGVPACIALATAAGWPAHRVDAVCSTLMGVWLGLQYQDDVADWQDDFARGGAWAVLLARRSASVDGDRGLGELRRLVFSSGVQAEMLDLAERHFTEAANGAEALGAHRLSSWARDRAAEARTQSEGERRNPGYATRSRELGPWKAEVLT